MNDRPVRLLMADPPWRFDQSHRPGGAGRHYTTLSLEDIERFPLPELAPDCLLLLWRVAMLQEEACRIVRAWGFTLAGELVWVKSVRPPALQIGLGRRVRAAHEVCLIGTRGDVPVAARDIPSVFFAPRTRHSAKPKEIYDIAERLVPDGPWYELFARRRWPDWASSGAEVPQGLLSFVE